MMPEQIVLAIGVTCLAVSVVLNIFSHRHLADARRLLADVRSCNEDFAEATALLRYGAVDEAIEVSQRWKERLGHEESE